MKTIDNETMTWRQLKEALEKLPENHLENTVMVYIPATDEFCPADLLINEDSSFLKRGEPYILAEVDVDEGEEDEEEE